LVQGGEGGVRAEVRSRAKEVAERLFAPMGDFDSFDAPLHAIEGIVESLDRETARAVVRHYDLAELRRQCRHYASVLSFIAETIDELLGAG